MDKIKAFLKAINPVTMLKATLKAAAIKAIEEEGNALQEAVKKAIANEGPGAVDRVFDAAQAALKSRIEAL